MQDWIVDGTFAADNDFDFAQKLADNVRVYQRARWFRGRFATEAVNYLSGCVGLAFYPDAKLTPFQSPPSLAAFHAVFAQGSAAGPGLNDVLHDVTAPAAWERATGAGVYIAIVDTGIDGSNPEFPGWKKAGGWSHDESDPWTDPCGHGTMCAAIAAASPGPQARMAGVAPGAKLYSCKTALMISDVISAYEWIEARYDEHRRPIVISNSYGFDTSTEPRIGGQPIRPDHPIAHVVRRVVASGIPVVFAAGNNHEPDNPQCSPNSIWAWNSLAEVLSVGEVDQTSRIRSSSSRGPGQWAGNQTKPDCVAPTYGWVLFGKDCAPAPTGWGTSGAAPQVAGLLALLREQKPQARPAALYHRVRSRCRSLEHYSTCVGSGIIDCAATLY